MTKKNLFKMCLSILIIGCFMFGIAFFASPAKANASDVSESVSSRNDPIISFDRSNGKLCVESNYWFHDEFIKSDMMHICERLSITNDDIKILEIKGFNYICYHSIYQLKNLTYLNIPEPLRTAVRLDKEAISSNPKLEKIDIGGIEWRTYDNDYYHGESICNNPKLTQINVKYDNWNKYYSKNISELELQEKLTDNGTKSSIESHGKNVHCIIHFENKDHDKSTLFQYDTNFEGYNVWHEYKS